MFSKPHIAALAALIVIAAPVFATTMYDARTVSSDHIAAHAMEVKIGHTITIEGLEFSEGLPEDIRLERFSVFADDAQIVVHGESGDTLFPPPANAYFHGRIEDRPHSRVVLSVLEGGGIRGIASDLGSFWALGEAMVDKNVRLIARELVDEDGWNAFSCMNGSDNMMGPASGNRAHDGHTPEAARRNAKRAALYTAKIAIETDQEFLNIFGGNQSNASDYIGDIIAYGSTIYADEVNTSWIVQHVSLWSSTDPWTQSSSACGLAEFGRYWNDNNSGISRTLASFFSGKSIMSGIAWVGVLCQGAFNTDITNWSCPTLTPSYDNYGGDYSFIGGMSGNFNINSPSTVWDIVAAVHELGHNFNSPHTHCYNGIGGNANPIDQCYNGECANGCYCGTNTLCGSAGSGCGTIMSYCHLLSGGMSNLSLTLGTGHPYGIAPERVPQRQYSHVLSQDSFYPGCLDLVAGNNSIFTDGFESGGWGSWSATVQ